MVAARRNRRKDASSMYTTVIVLMKDRYKFKHKQIYDVVRFQRWLSKKKELGRLLRPIYFSCLLLFDIFLLGTKREVVISK